MRGSAVFLAVSVLAAASAGAAGTNKPTFIQDVVAGKSHENGEARWNSVVFSQLSNVCWLTGKDRRIELGKKARPDPRANAVDCVASSAWIHNTSQRPIYCRAVLELNQPDDSGRTRITGQRLVMPNDMQSVATSYGEKAKAPSKALTECEVKDDAQPPAPCSFKILRAPDPDAFYPAESRDRREQGDVVLEFLVDPAAQKLRDIRVSESSGYQLLDIAALKVGQGMVATATCQGLRRKLKVKFRADVADPAPPPAS